MPAIHPDRLKKQSSLLMEQFENPELFTRSLFHFFESYAENIHRPGQSGNQSPIIPSFKVKPPVLRQLFKDLFPLAEKNPSKALELCDHFWQVPYFEFRITAAALLGKIHIDPPDPVLSRIHTWIQKDTEDLVLDIILSRGLENLRSKNSVVFYNLIEEWLSTKDIFYQKIGLRLLLSHIENFKVENIPIIFRLILPYCRELHPSLYPDLADILRSLAGQTPSETAYFLIQTMRLPNSSDAPWLIRQILTSFPNVQQSELKLALKEWKFENQ